MSVTVLTYLVLAFGPQGNCGGDFSFPADARSPSVSLINVSGLGFFCYLRFTLDHVFIDTPCSERFFFLKKSLDRKCI